MARQINHTSGESPIIERPGVIDREKDFWDNPEAIDVPPEHPERAAKGDLGMQHIPDFEPRPLTTPGLPFKNLRGGK